MPIDRSLLESMIMQGLAPDDQTQLTFKEDGTVSYTRKPFAEPKGEKKTAQPSEGGKQPTDPGENIPVDRGAIPQSALAQYLAPSAGPAASSLRGLMPEQVMAVINAQRMAGEARGRTISQLMQQPLLQAQIAKLKASLVPKPVEPPTELEKAKTIQAREAARLAGRRADVIEPSLTLEEQKELREGRYRTQIYQRDGENRVGFYDDKGNFVKDVRKATPKEVLGTVESGLARESFEYRKQTTAARTRLTIRKDPESKEARDLVPTANKGSQDTTLMLWTGYGEWWGNEVKTFELPTVEGHQLVADDIPGTTLERLGEGKAISFRTPSGKVIWLKANKKLEIEVLEKK